VRAMSVSVSTWIALREPKQGQTVPLGQSFNVSGTLYGNAPVDGYQSVPLSGMPIVIYVDGVAVGSATTDSSGNFTFTLRIDTAGVHTIKVVFPGYPPSGGGERQGPGVMV